MTGARNLSNLPTDRVEVNVERTFVHVHELQVIAEERAQSCPPDFRPCKQNYHRRKKTQQEEWQEWHDSSPKGKKWDWGIKDRKEQEASLWTRTHVGLGQKSALLTWQCSLSCYFCRDFQYITAGISRRISEPLTVWASIICCLTWQESLTANQWPFKIWSNTLRCCIPENDTHVDSGTWANMYM